MTAFEKYKIGEIPHIHIGDNLEENIFSDALVFQAKRIQENLQNFFPKKTEQEIKKMMFFKDKCLGEI